MPNSDRSARSINFGLFLRKAGGISNLMQTLQNLGLSTTARNFLGPFRNQREISVLVCVFEHVNTVFFDEPICRMPNPLSLYISTDSTKFSTHIRTSQNLVCIRVLNLVLLNLVLNLVVLNLVLNLVGPVPVRDRAGARRRDHGRGHRRGRDPGAASSLPVSVP
jgi:hypothetical protein